LKGVNECQYVRQKEDSTPAAIHMNLHQSVGLPSLQAKIKFMLFAIERVDVIKRKPRAVFCCDTQAQFITANHITIFIFDSDMQNPVKVFCTFIDQHAAHIVLLAKHFLDHDLGIIGLD